MRIEHDLLGERKINDECYYGIHTLRALENFNLSGRPIHSALVDALVTVKKACAITNRDIGILNERVGNAIIEA